MRRNFETNLCQHADSPHEHTLARPRVSMVVTGNSQLRTGSTLLVVIALMGMLALLGLILAAEQTLAYWASYHASPGTTEPRVRATLGGSR